MAGERTVALAGNPNVGKSTLFNALTGMHQHTGNWAGKTVEPAAGSCRTEHFHCRITDLPGTYSLMSSSVEEEAARDHLCFCRPDAAVVVCDAACLERNLNLVLQVMEICPRVLVCVNLLDEAERRGIRPDTEELSRLLGVPVVATVARKRGGEKALLKALDALLGAEAPERGRLPRYTESIEKMISKLEPELEEICAGALPARWLALKMLEGDEKLLARVESFLGRSLPAVEQVGDREQMKDEMVGALMAQAEEISSRCLKKSAGDRRGLDRRLDRVLTSRGGGYPLMLLMLAGILWISIVGANAPSRWLSSAFAAVQELLSALLLGWGAPLWLHDALVLGIYRVLTWVIAVMLPPMAIFFPLFTLMEDAGFLPRVAYNLDKAFSKCGACGKQALCMAMGFGCNAVGVTGSRIIDSPRERLLAILTNSLVPCNGRFPTLVAVISMFFAAGGTLTGSLLSAASLTGVIVLGVAASLAATRLLSATLLKGVPSAFILELPPYRRPRLGQVIVRSVLDRTLFVLGRAASVAAPAGLIIWLMANIRVGDMSLLAHCAGALDPLARLMGLDGVILMAFILGFPANEIVLPIAIMAYMAQGSLADMGSIAEMRALLEANGWTAATAVSVILFSLMHWPCSTTLLTIKKETGSLKWTALAFALPTAMGVGACVLFTAAARLLGA